MSLEALKATSKIDIEKLKTRYLALHNVVQWYIGPNGEVDADNLPKDIAERLDGWLCLNYEPPMKTPVPEPQTEAQAEYVNRWIAGRKGLPQQPQQPARPVVVQPVVATPPPPQPAAPPSAPTPKPWKTGDTLPDNATVAQLHTASVEEVKEWKRRKQGKDGR